jgi:uncharacterized OsmC-like protein
MNPTLPPITTAVHRVRSAFKRRPEVAVHSDTPATARWQGGCRVLTAHPDGTQLPTDMPPELGGTGDQVTPGWLFRAGLASCAATSIVLAAAAEGMDLAALEVHVGSVSDSRGLLGMSDEAGQPVHAGPSDMQLQVRIDAPGATPEQVRALVEAALRCSPVPSAVQHATVLSLQLEIVAGA